MADKPTIAREHSQAEPPWAPNNEIEAQAAYLKFLGQMRRDLPVADNPVIGNVLDGYEIGVFLATITFTASADSNIVTVPHALRSTPLVVVGSEQGSGQGVSISVTNPTTTSFQVQGHVRAAVSVNVTLALLAVCR